MTEDTNMSRKCGCWPPWRSPGGLIMLDETVIGVALPTVRHDLAMSGTGAHWVISIYMLVFACLAAASGRLGDIIGFRRLLMVGTGPLGLGSLMSGLATNGAMLIAARAVQGLGAAALFPMTVAMIMVAFPKDNGHGHGHFGGNEHDIPRVGALVGGYLSETISWRWIFWINIPVVAIASAIVLSAFPRQPAPRHTRTVRRSRPPDTRRWIVPRGVFDHARPDLGMEQSRDFGRSGRRSGALGRVHHHRDPQRRAPCSMSGSSSTRRLAPPI